MTFLNPLPIFFWFIPLIPIFIFLINRRKHQLVRFSSIRFLNNLKTSQINKIRLLNILLLIIRVLFLIVVLIIVMRPEISSVNLPSNIENNKISNIVLIDDSFSNKYGIINGEERKLFIENIIEDICKNYPLESNLKIIALNKGPIFNGFNDQKFDYLSYDIQNYNFVNIDDFLNKEDNFDFKNLHIISNSNKESFKKNKELYNQIENKNNLRVFYHYIPESSNNQYIRNIKFIGNKNGFFDYAIEIGNSYTEDINLILSANQNKYDYSKSSLSINQAVPILNKDIKIKSNSSIIDTVSIALSPDYFVELLFKLEKRKNNLIVDLIDDRIEDNTYSYIMDIPNKIDISVFFEDKKSIKYIKPALDAFKFISSDIDSNFLITACSPAFPCEGSNFRSMMLARTFSEPLNLLLFFS